MSTFTETQKFRQWWLWLILGVVTVPVIITLVRAPTSWPFALVLISVFSLFWFWRMDTRCDQDGVQYRVYPLIGWRTIHWVDIATATVTTYGFVGYGIRWNFGEWVYNVSGNQGLRIKTTADKRILIGTQRPDQLRAFLSSIPMAPASTV